MITEIKDDKEDDMRRTGLHELYKIVKTCSKCNKKYGTDRLINDNGMCSSCSKQNQIMIKKLKGGIK
jgi:uncharacterized Fe-S radical SAM superfamily protein PflX